MRHYGEHMGSVSESLYGLDIETDTTVDGLDPAVGGVTAVALVGDQVEEVFETSPSSGEAEMLKALDRCLAELPAGVIVTWNGAGFDLPFLTDRADRLGIELGLRLRLDPAIPLRREPLTGHPGAYRASWHHHRHLDAYRVYRADVGPALGISCGLKSIARVVGLAPVEVDREQIHELSAAALRRYVTSDARLARLLAIRRWSHIASHVDGLVT